MDIKTFVTIAPKLPPQMAILMRGPTGIGKSFLAKAIAEYLGLPFIDVRGSTMDESKVTGIPDFVASKELGVSTFVLPSWFVRACREPVVLMLDEINRSMPQVMQSFFQIVLDRELGNDGNGNPMKLHPGTRVIAAGNFGTEYDVAEIDPALLRRFWVQDIENTTEDFLSWAESCLDPVLVDFIRQNPVHLRVDPSTVESGIVCPAPASWHRLNDSLVHMGWSPTDMAGCATVPGFHGTCSGFVGVEASIAFTTFVAKYELQISAEMVLGGKVDKKMMKAMKASESLALLDKVVFHNLENDWTSAQCAEMAKVLAMVPEEQLVHFWNKLMKSKRMPNVTGLHKLGMGDKVIALVAKSTALSKKAG
jgi:hypothetical protein